MGRRNSPAWGMLYDREKQKGNANRAMMAVARKMVAYLVAVDRRQKDSLVAETENYTPRGLWRIRRLSLARSQPGMPGSGIGHARRRQSLGTVSGDVRA